MAVLINENPPNTIQWGFYKTSPNKYTQTIHYYDTFAQEIWPTGTHLSTKTTKVVNGQWQESVYTPEEPIKITAGSYTNLRSDHPTNGVLYMSAIKGGKLEFLRYQYMMDLSHLLDSWRQQYKNDSPISDLSLNIQNIDTALFMSESSIFLPGSRIDKSVMFDKYELPMGIYWLDEVSFDQTGDSVSLSSRNYCGHFLNDQTMDELTVLEGTMNEIIPILFEHAGITNYLIQPGFATVNKYTFEPSDTILQAFDKIIKSSSNPQTAFELVLLESQGGGLIFGRRNWTEQYMANSYYTFHEGEDLFARRTDKCLDGSYTRIMVTGKNKEDKDHTPIFVDVKNFKHWSIKPHKTKHIKAPTKMTVDEFTAFANAQAEAFQYVGINQDFTGPYRPQLYVGDIAEVLMPDGISGTSLGLINQITHNFSRDDGFTTEFVVDSGGIATEGDAYVIYSSSSNDNGRNRKLSVIDVIKIMSK